MTPLLSTASGHGQHQFGKPPRNSYHDKQWAGKMRQIGLIPTATGEEGGKETGQKMHHLIEEGGPFQRAFVSLLASQPAILTQTAHWMRTTPAKKASQ
jgi:hypothetical protein